MDVSFRGGSFADAAIWSLSDNLFEKSVFFKTIFWRVFAVFGWVSGGYLALSGFPECFFGGFWPFVGPHIGPDCGTNGFVHLV